MKAKKAGGQARAEENEWNLVESFPKSGLKRRLPKGGQWAQKVAEEGGLKITSRSVPALLKLQKTRDSPVRLSLKEPVAWGSGLDLRESHSPYSSTLRCQCNGHADTCNEQDGTGCPCQNNTETGTCQGSSPSDRRDCYKYQVCLGKPATGLGTAGAKGGAGRCALRTKSMPRVWFGMEVIL